MFCGSWWVPQVGPYLWAKASVVLRPHSVLALGSRPSRSAPLTPGPAHHTESCPSTEVPPPTGTRPSHRVPPLNPGPAPHALGSPGNGASGSPLQPETWKRIIQGCKPSPSSCANSAAQWVDFTNQTPSSRSISCKGRDSCYFCAKLIEFRSKNSL